MNDEPNWERLLKAVIKQSGGQIRLDKLWFVTVDDFSLVLSEDIKTGVYELSIMPEIVIDVKESDK